MCIRDSGGVGLAAPVVAAVVVVDLDGRAGARGEVFPAVLSGGGAHVLLSLIHI